VQTQAQTGVSTGTGVLNSFQYLETGILLAVTPRINSGGLVTLEVNQEVSAPSSTPTVINPNPDISTRSAKTSVVVASGESIALAGLIREVVTYDSTGIPLLSKIPLIGAAFGTQSFNRERTELVLVITPKIISDPAQAREATQELKERLPSLRGLLPHLETHGNAGSTSPPAEMTVPTQSAAPFIAAPPAPAPAAPAPASPTGATPGTPLSNPTPPPK
jgi:general secretion pathway protein D